MQTETVHAVASHFFVSSEEIEQQAQLLLAALRGVEWYGSNREFFEAEMEQLLMQFFTLVGSAQSLSARMGRQAELWQEMDMVFAQQFTSTSRLLTVMREGEAA